MKNLVKFENKAIQTLEQKDICGGATRPGDAYGYGKDTARYAIKVYGQFTGLPGDTINEAIPNFSDVRNSQAYQSDNVSCFDKGWTDQLQESGYSFMNFNVSTTC